MESHKDVIYRKKRQKKSVFMKLKQKREKKQNAEKDGPGKKNVAHTSFDSVVETNVEICDLLAYRVRSHTKWIGSYN